MKVAQKLTRLLDILGDGKWHGTEQISRLMDLNSCKVQEIAEFLGKYDFAEVDEEKKRVRINKDFKKILAEAV